ncbi:MAG TPA: hypothetical protein VHD34_03980 [Xanthobacteraceae bacterium]|nr:hypothetical protein [Xanthobacteraceae bacterium]
MTAAIPMLRHKHVLLTAFLFASAPALAQEVMTADMAREFVIGRFFTYHCFDGTYGSGRIERDGSAAGTIRVTGKGVSHFLHLPTNTLYVLGNQVCARLRGLPFEPCFNLVKTGPETFRGSLSNMNFMYCVFERKGGASQLARRRGTGAKHEKKSEKKAEKKAEEVAEKKTEEKKPEATPEAKPMEIKPASDDTDSMKLRR